jgi:hypothetical protein
MNVICLRRNVCVHVFLPKCELKGLRPNFIKREKWEFCTEKPTKWLRSAEVADRKEKQQKDIHCLYCNTNKNKAYKAIMQPAALQALISSMMSSNMWTTPLISCWKVRPFRSFQSLQCTRMEMVSKLFLPKINRGTHTFRRSTRSKMKWVIAVKIILT